MERTNNSRHIYKIICTENNRFYIGQTYDVNKRLKRHMNGRDTNAEMWNDVQKYGKDKFKVEILHTLEDGEMIADKGSKYFINTIERAYNLYYSDKYPELIYNKNDVCNWALCSDKRAKKIGAALKGRKSPMKGKIRSDETKEKISIALTGKKRKPFTDETKEKMRIAQIGNKNGTGKRSDETKKKIRKNHADFSGKNHPFFGKHHSNETRKNMSIAQTKRWAEWRHNKK